MLRAYRGADRTAEEAGPCVERTSTATHMKLLIVDRHLDALLQCGRLGEASSLASRYTADGGCSRRCRLLFLMWPSRARIGPSGGSAVMLADRRRELFMGDSNGFRYLIPLTTALAMCGLAEDAAAALRAVESEHHRELWVCGLRARSGPRLGGRLPGCGQRSDQGGVVRRWESTVPMGNSRSCVCRPRRSSVTGRRWSVCANSKRSWKAPGSVSPPASPQHWMRMTG